MNTCGQSGHANAQQKNATPRFLLPAAGDNAAIATERIEAGDLIEIEGQLLAVKTAIPKGHRLCVKRIQKDEGVLSWGYPFGYASVDINPGDYLCNERMKDVLTMRNPEDYPLGLNVNFTDRDSTKEQTLPQRQTLATNERKQDSGPAFMGYYRGPGRGWGTRNDVAIIGVTSRARSLVLAATEDLQGYVRGLDNVDALTPVVHTEGGSSGVIHNKALLLRTLAGFAVNPNIAAAVFVNDPDSPVSNAELLHQLNSLGNVHLESKIRYFVSAGDSGESVSGLTAVVRPLLDGAAKCVREPAPFEGLKVGLQCGGSDAFSGVTANPLLGAVVEKLLQRGATANLAETDELIGAEEHVLAKVADQSVAEEFLAKLNAFKNYAQRHGQTAEGNVSGGNLYRGLYNITLKSLGAGRKKDPNTALEYVIAYGERMELPGYYFMDSPGNDLESIAGQVAAGANLILFTTGNGSITNFPFVPTIKIVTTNERFALLETDMDFNAGLLLNGLGQKDTAQQLLELTCRIASGEKSKGEYTGQSQVQIWRDWRQDGSRTTDANLGHSTTCSGKPLVPAGHRIAVPAHFSKDYGSGSERRRTIEILPTSLCSGQVAEQIAAKMNASLTDAGSSNSWEVVALPHTEGCGVSGGDAEEIYTRTILGYAMHPAVSHTIFLEHGCEKTHNDFFKDSLRRRGVDTSHFGWAGIQNSGGITAVSGIVGDLIQEHIHGHAASSEVPGEPTARIIGLATTTPLSDPVVGMAVDLVQRLLAEGTSVIVSETDLLLTSEAFLEKLKIGSAHPTIPYAGSVEAAGLHVMQASTSDWLEISTGLGATGAEALIVFAHQRPVQPHRMLPVLQIGTGTIPSTHKVFDITANNQDLSVTSGEIISKLNEIHRGHYVPVVTARPNVGFQISRGSWGVSL
ncbi:UxaA family hydrolase [Arthrobacter sp. D3-16]